MNTRGLFLLAVLSLILSRVSLQLEPEVPEPMEQQEGQIIEQSPEDEQEQIEGSVFDAIEQQEIQYNPPQEMNEQTDFSEVEIPKLEETIADTPKKSDEVDSVQIQTQIENDSEVKDPCTQQGLEHQCTQKREEIQPPIQEQQHTTSILHSSVKQEVEEGEEKPKPYMITPMETYMVLEFLLAFQSRMHKAVDFSILAIAYINRDLGVPQPYDSISFFVTLAIGLLILRRIPLCLCAKKKMYGHNSLSNLDYGPLINATKQMQGEVERLKKEVKAMKEAQRDIIVECFSQIKLPTFEQIPPPSVPVAPAPVIPQQVIVEKESSKDIEELKLNLSKIQESIGGLKKDFQQQAEDQEEFQAVTMEAIKKIYEAITHINRPHIPMPRPGSRQEEMSAEDQGLFTPPQMPFQQSSSGNGGPTDLGTPGGHLGEPSQKMEGGLGGAGQNERPTFDQQFSD